jgi:hypothetical protein
MFAQPAPWALQRRHWYEYVIVLELVHEPLVAESVLPT